VLYALPISSSLICSSWFCLVKIKIMQAFIFLPLPPLMPKYSHPLLFSVPHQPFSGKIHVTVLKWATISLFYIILNLKFIIIIPFDAVYGFQLTRIRLTTPKVRGVRNENRPHTTPSLVRRRYCRHSEFLVSQVTRLVHCLQSNP
jgi:hypothetical protein